MRLNVVVCKHFREVFFAVILFLSSGFSDGLPGEYLITQRWRDMFAGHSPLHNPAILTTEDYPTFRYAHSMILNNLFSLWELGYTQPIGLNQSMGFSWFGESAGQISTSSVDLNQNITGADSRSENQNNFFVLSYAIRPFKVLSIGANVNVAYQTLFGYPAAGVGVDAGAALLLPPHKVIGRHTLGVFFQNLVPVKLYTETSRIYSSNLKFSWLIGLLNDRIETGIDMNIKDLRSPFAKKDAVAEELPGLSKRKTEFDLNYRLGFHALSSIKTYFQAGSGYWGLTGGLSIPKLNRGRNLMFLYQYMNLTKGNIQNTHSFYTMLGVGRSRDDVYAGRVARLAKIEQTDLYNRACRLYREKKYWDAFLVFSELVSKYPRFHLIDKAEYYKAGCFEGMDMREQAVAAYEKVKEDHKGSDVVSFSDLGIMRIKYRQNDFRGVKDRFSPLDSRHVPDSLKQHAHYILGEAYMNQKHYASAQKEFNLVSKYHPEYVFAQHSCAVAAINMGKFDEAEIRLNYCVNADITTKEQQEIVDRSLLFLGYLYYKRGALSSAVSALNEVSETSFYYPHSLLCRGWVALKAKQWEDCISAGEKAGNSSKRPEVMAEAALLESYGYVMKKEYPHAERILKNASDLIKAVDFPAESEIRASEKMNFQQRTVYDRLSSRIWELSDKKQNLDKIKELKPDCDKTYGQIRDYIKFRDDLNSFKFIISNIDNLREDIEYALAIVMKKSLNMKADMLSKELREKTSDIDKEIKKLEEEMNEIGKEEAD